MKHGYQPPTLTSHRYYRMLMICWSGVLLVTLGSQIMTTTSYLWAAFCGAGFVLLFIAMRILTRIAVTNLERVTDCATCGHVFAAAEPKYVVTRDHAVPRTVAAWLCSVCILTAADKLAPQDAPQ